MKEKPEEIFEGIVTQKLVIVQAGKVLCVRGFGSDMYDLPGGRLHKNEDPKEGLKREVMEELGCECAVGSVIDVAEKYHTGPGKSCYFVVFEGSIPDEANLNIATDEISEYEWVDFKDVSATTTWDPYDQILIEYFKTQIV